MPELNNILDDLDAWKLVVPEEKRAEIMFEAHNEPTAAHPGKERTYQKIAQAYYWIGIYEDTARYVASCTVCQQFKNDQRAKIGLMGARDITRPWQVVCADLMGEFPRSTNGYKYLAIFEDIFSRFIICIPLRSKHGNRIKEALEKNVCMMFGTPEKFLTDHGTEMRCAEVTNFLKESNIESIVTPVTSAQCNPTERVNRDFKVRIASYVNENHKNWDENIHKFQFAHNTLKNSVTGKTPAFMVFGRELQAPKLWRRQVESSAAEDDSKSTKESDSQNINSALHRSDDSQENSITENLEDLENDRESENNSININIPQRKNPNKELENFNKVNCNKSKKIKEPLVQNFNKKNKKSKEINFSNENSNLLTH